VWVSDEERSGGRRNMTKYKLGDTVLLDGRYGRVVWAREDANEIEAIDEYIVEFEDKHRRFAISCMLNVEKANPIHN